MADTDITLFFNKHRMEAMQRHLAAQGSSVEELLYQSLNTIYADHVPEQEREDIDLLISIEHQQEQAAIEASKRFSVVHLHDADTDYHFTSELHTSFLQSARLYRLVTKDLKSPLPSVDAMSYAYMSHRPISPQKFSELCDSIATDNRITAIIEFDFEDGTVGVCQSSDNAWRTYRLKDLSVAAFKAHRSSYSGTDSREKIFNTALVGKEIDPPGAAEHTVKQLGVIHICENGNDSYFLSHQTPSFFAAANLYRQYENGTARGNPSTFADAFGEVTRISEDAYEAHSDHIPYDPHIKFAAEFYLDGGVCSVLDSKDNSQWFYDLNDVTSAAQKAYRQNDISMSKRQEVFDNILCGRELDPDEWVERKHGGNSDGNGEAPVMRM